MTVSEFGSVNGHAVQQIALHSAGGLHMDVLTYGAIIRDLRLPDGQSMVLGYESIDAYAHDPNYFGAVVGRFANRIGGGRFTVDGQTFLIDRNEGGTTTLHGGTDGFHRRLWSIMAVARDQVTLALLSPDGDQGFPGTVDVRCSYRLSDDHGLEVQFTATTSAPCPVSLAQHSYFTLGARDVRGLTLTVHADDFTPVDAALVPTGMISRVDLTPFDFRTSRRVGDAARGIDLNFVPQGTGLRCVAQVENPANGRGLDVYSTQPGLQVYDGQMILPPGPHKGFAPWAGLCLETQALPDSPNHPAFPDAILRPGQTYRHRTEYRFR